MLPPDGIEKMEKTYEKVTCGRCSGSGIFYWATFQGHDSGECFKCAGSGLISVRTFTPEHRAKLDAQKAKRDAKKAQEAREAFAFETERAAEMATLREVQNSSFDFIAGEVGETVEVEGKVAFQKVIDSQYGSSLLMIVRVDFEHEVKMFTTANWAWATNVGDSVRIRGTIKAQDIYEGRKATQLTKVKAA